MPPRYWPLRVFKKLCKLCQPACRPPVCRPGAVSVGKHQACQSGQRSSAQGHGAGVRGGVSSWGACMRSVHRSLHVLRLRSLRTTPVWACSCHCTPRVVHHCATALSRSKVKPLPVSSWACKWLKACAWCKRSSTSVTSPVITCRRTPQALSCTNRSRKHSRKKSNCLCEASGPRQ